MTVINGSMVNTANKTAWEQDQSGFQLGTGCRG